MTKKLLFKIGAPILVLSLIAACGGTTDEEDPIDGESSTNEEEFIDGEPPINQEDYNDSNVPTENEKNEDFGKELEDDKAKDIPENHLENDEETPSAD